jgi:ABC-type transport system involved in multi-copper enzyme maturation permease subunit
MKNITVTLMVEFLKMRKSKIFPVTIIIFMIIPMMMALMMFVARNPEIAGKLGMIGMKAKMFGENDWPGYFALLNQALASVGLLGFGFVSSWVFAREHSDRTMKDLLALPVARSYIVLAKIIIIFLWCLLLTLIIYIVSISMGLFMNLPAWSTPLFSQFSCRLFITAMLTFLLCTPVTFLSGYSQGIIAPLGFVLLTMIMAQFIGLVGLGPYFPWAIPGLYAVNGQTAGMQLHGSSYIILFVTFAIGYWATLRWWQKADHH